MSPDPPNRKNYRPGRNETQKHELLLDLNQGFQMYLLLNAVYLVFQYFYLLIHPGYLQYPALNNLHYHPQAGACIYSYTVK